MKNVKFIAGFSIFGFLLSIISSLGAHRNFGLKIVIALVFAVVFGACAFLISYLYSNFLESDTGSDLGDAQTSSNPAVSQPVSGNHTVDITVQDEDLPSEENENQFFVGSKRQMLNETDMTSVNKIQSENPAAEQIRSENQNSAAPQTVPAAKSASAPNGGFVPVSLAENADNFTSVEAKPVPQEKTAPKMQSLDSSSESLDELPDLEEISDAPVTAPMQDAGVQEESDFSQNKNVSKSGGTSAEEVTQGKDAELMAKAISTLLAKE